MKSKIIFYLAIFLINSSIITENHYYHTYLNQLKNTNLDLPQRGILIDSLKFLFRRSYNYNNPYKDVPAKVRISDTLCEQEKVAISKRLKKAKLNLERFLNVNLQEDKFPKIAICTSGGGYRAMIATIGSLIGAKEIGLIDSIIYASSLSGSTWAIGTWTSIENDLNKLKEQLSDNLSKNPKIGKLGLLPTIKEPTQIKKLVTNLTAEFLFNQPLESIDIYGALLANNLFFPLQNRQNLKLSDQKKNMEDGNHIFPIYTAIEPKDEDFQYNWYEFTPFEIGNIPNNCYIPTWAFGREFIAGESISCSTIFYEEFGPEFNLGYLFGIFGSAFQINIEEIVRMLETENLNYLERSVINVLLKKLLSPIEEERLFPAKTHNFAYGLENVNSNQKNLILVDAGIDFNLPFPPLLRPERNIDVIIVIDASADLDNAPELKKAEQYARMNNLKFPKINYTNINKKTISVFNDPNDIKTPTIIYMPLVKDINIDGIEQNPLLKNFEPHSCIENGFCNTLNCSYSKEQFNQLCELTRFNMIKNTEKIKEAIIKKIT